jgi:hypothetical protein
MPAPQARASRGHFPSRSCSAPDGPHIELALLLIPSESGKDVIESVTIEVIHRYPELTSETFPPVLYGALAEIIAAPTPSADERGQVRWLSQRLREIDEQHHALGPFFNAVKARLAELEPEAQA